MRPDHGLENSRGLGTPLRGRNIGCCSVAGDVFKVAVVGIDALPKENVHLAFIYGESSAHNSDESAFNERFS